MKKNLYYRSLHRRENLIKKFFLSLFAFFASGSRLLLEVFIRKNFGERYFKLSAAILLTIQFGLLPLLLVFIQKQFPSEHDINIADYDFLENEAAVASSPMASAWSQYITWYIFLAAFLAMSIKHHLDMKKQPSVFDFQKFSLFSGDYQNFVWKLPFFKATNPRDRECYLEPLLFLIIGIPLVLLDQHVGWLIIICSIFYSMNYISDYESGDNFVMDLIDEKMSNEEMEKNFVEGLDPSATRGTNFRGRKPSNKEYRRQLLPSMIVDEDVLIAE